MLLHSYFDCWLPNLFAAFTDSTPSIAHIFKALPRACHLPFDYKITIDNRMIIFQHCPSELMTTTALSTLQLPPSLRKPFLVGMPPLPNYLNGFAKEQRFSVCRMHLCTCELLPTPPLPESNTGLLHFTTVLPGLECKHQMNFLLAKQSLLLAGTGPNYHSMDYNKELS